MYCVSLGRLIHCLNCRQFADSEGFQVLVLCVVDLFNCYSAFIFLFFMLCPKICFSKSLAHMQSVLGLQLITDTFHVMGLINVLITMPFETYPDISYE